MVQCLWCHSMKKETVIIAVNSTETQGSDRVSERASNRKSRERRKKRIMHTSAFCEPYNTLNCKKKNMFFNAESLLFFLQSPFPFLHSPIEMPRCNSGAREEAKKCWVYYIAFVGWISKWRLLFIAIPCTVYTWFLLWIRAHVSHHLNAAASVSQLILLHIYSFFLIFISWSSACTFNGTHCVCVCVPACVRVCERAISVNMPATHRVIAFLLHSIRLEMQRISHLSIHCVCFCFGCGFSNTVYFCFHCIRLVLRGRKL